MTPILLAAVLVLAQDPQKELDKLKADIAAKSARVEELQRLLAKQEADQEVFVRQLEVQLAQIQELAANVEEHRGNFRKALNDKKLLEAELASLRKPSASLDGKVTAAAAETGLVVVSLGKDDGIREGDELTVTRDGGFVSTIRIDRTERKSSTGKVLVQTGDTRVGDRVSDRPPPVTLRPAAPESPETIRGLRKELDCVRRQVRELSDRLLPAWGDPGLALDEASEELRVHLGLARGLVVRGVREGSAAEKSGLKPFDVIPDLSEAQLVEAVAKGATIRVVRRGAAQSVGGK